MRIIKFMSWATASAERAKKLRKNAGPISVQTPPAEARIGRSGSGRTIELFGVLLGALLVPAVAAGEPSGAAVMSAGLLAATPVLPAQSFPPPSASPSSPPVCAQPCDAGRAAVDYAVTLVRAEQHAAARSYLSSCYETCPSYSCVMTSLYHDATADAKQHVPNKQFRQDSARCRGLLADSKGRVDGAGTRDDVEQVYRTTHRPHWAGIGLVAGGAALTIVSIGLLGAASANRLPLAGDCSKESGIIGDPCVADLSKPGTQAALGIPLALGVGSLAAGVALLVKY